VLQLTVFLRSFSLAPHCATAASDAGGIGGGLPRMTWPSPEAKETSMREGAPQYVRWICSGCTP
jgi:hypothetical protein